MAVIHNLKIISKRTKKIQLKFLKIQYFLKILIHFLLTLLSTGNQRTSGAVTGEIATFANVRAVGTTAASEATVIAVTVFTASVEISIVL